MPGVSCTPPRATRCGLGVYSTFGLRWSIAETAALPAPRCMARMSATAGAGAGAGRGAARARSPAAPGVWSGSARASTYGRRPAVPGYFPGSAEGVREVHREAGLLPARAAANLDVGDVLGDAHGLRIARLEA